MVKVVTHVIRMMLMLMLRLRAGGGGVGVGTSRRTTKNNDNNNKQMECCRIGERRLDPQTVDNDADHLMNVMKTLEGDRI